MVVFIAGATGFIGRHLAEALARAGHAVISGSRNPANSGRNRAIAVDFARDVDPDTWVPRLAGVDVVINAVGILRERRGQTYAALHRDAPKALFTASAQAGVHRIIQISALGADAHARSRYHRSKRAADEFLAAMPVSHAIVQPSLVYGPGGTSARLFGMMASLPWIPVPGNGEQPVQPVHIDDLVSCVVALVAEPDVGGRVPIVGPEPLALRAFLADLRTALGMRSARIAAVPLSLVRIAARIGEHVPGGMLDRETLAMLERGNTADVGDTRRLLGRDPRAVKAFVDVDHAPAVRARAKLDWLLPLLRLAIALVWIATGIVSFGIYPVEESYALLARVGVPSPLAPLMLYGAALLDIALGVATLALPRRRWLWVSQIALILLYTALITWRLPEFWLHPYGPILKNLPMLAALWMLLELEES